jgi:hypothetical protein
VTAVFLGPDSYVGSGGGGTEFSTPVDRENNFHGTFRVPADYPTGGEHNRLARVTPGSGYRLSVYPAAMCTIPFHVTPSK